jgi:hypothetical protein
MACHTALSQAKQQHTHTFPSQSMHTETAYVCKQGVDDFLTQHLHHCSHSTMP